MHSQLLRHFLAVIDCRGISSAAKEIHITQPALTRSVRRLEEILGVKLLERLPTGVAPTAFGEVLARRVRLIELEYRHALTEIEAMKGGMGGSINVGAAPVWIAQLLPPIIAEFQRERPKVKIKLSGGVIDTMVPALLGGEFDVICSSLDFPSHPEIIKEQLIEFRHVLVVRPQHPLANRREITAGELLDYPWIGLSNDYVGGARVNSFFAAHELAPPRIAVETNSTSGLLSLLQAGDFIVNIPTLMLNYAEVFGLKALNVHGTLWEAPAGIAYRRTNNPIPAISLFCGLIRSRVAEITAEYRPSPPT
ncbi:MAG: LysR family transcriptional regulator [Rhodoplanes sp.]